MTGRFFLFRLIALLFLVVMASVALAPRLSPQAGPIVPVPRPTDVNPRRAALGELLFADVSLSRTRQYSCATCHPIDGGGMDARRLPAIARRDAPPRNTPTIFNAALNASFNWDGSAGTLETHTSAVVENLMDLEWPALIERLRASAHYAARFAAIYPQGLAKDTVIDAIVSYERTLLTPDARFDRFLRGDEQALTRDEQEGYRRFKSYGCASCHQGVNAGGNLYQRFGIFEPVRLLPLTEDPGRIRVTHAARDRDVFRVPGLRNVAVTAPYFHDGRAATLEEAVGIMGRHQLGRRLEREDVRLVAAFLRTLTGEYRGRPLTAPQMNEKNEKNEKKEASSR